MFHIYFLRKFRNKPDLGQIAVEYDQFYGIPSHRDRLHFQKNIKKILEVTTWPQFYKMCDLPVPSPLALTNKLKQAVKNSLNRGYHNTKTNFAGILASGVSKILLKGQTYTVTPISREFT